MLKLSLGLCAVLSSLNVFAFSPSIQEVQMPYGCKEIVYCTAHVDNTVACVGGVKGQGFKVSNSGGDNACTLTLKLRDKICDAGLDSLKATYYCK